MLGTHHAVEGLLVDEAQVDGLLAQGGAVLVRGLGDLGGVVVADGRRQCRHQHQRFLHQLLDPGLVGLDAHHHVVGEGRGAVAQKLHRLQHVVAHHRVVDVELEVALRACHADGGVVAHDMGADHGQSLGLGRVHLAGHDRGAGLVLRQDQLTKARARAGAQQTDVVGDLEQRRGHGLERAREHHHGVMRGEGFELVGRGDEGQAGDLGHVRGDGLAPALLGVEPGAHGGAALRQLVDVGQAGLDAGDALADLVRVARELLAQGQRRSVLGVGAADLDDVLERVSLGFQRGGELLQPRQQHVARLHGDAHMHGRRESVVRRLAHVAVIVRVDGLFRAHLAAQHLDGTVRDHLVGVHVRLGARAGLPDNEREVVVELAVDHLAGGGDDGVGDLGLHRAVGFVGHGAGLLHHAERADDRHRLLFPADREVHDRALGLRAPVLVCGNLERAEAVGFGAGLGHGNLLWNAVAQSLTPWLGKGKAAYQGIPLTSGSRADPAAGITACGRNRVARPRRHAAHPRDAPGRPRAGSDHPRPRHPRPNPPGSRNAGQTRRTDPRRS
ncbi:hypothetical protein R2601_23383 [Salipiger bermudensis HTCC2601]|uniref:Uncharacterized protein n=1 Tax=Salipiger bermudensis (strain DSM 26914 / JCM 13377 / KCTC 12554 / HTCC2601) TaxID=314265 RepID=Q0FH14_SALBH|nr:hypothetical protein R2601_23383 [Salipiger bermudensis HTCC2601]